MINFVLKHLILTKNYNNYKNQYNDSIFIFTFLYTILV